jgi:hypothetical protein
MLLDLVELGPGGSTGVQLVLALQHPAKSNTPSFPFPPQVPAQSANYHLKRHLQYGHNKKKTYATEISRIYDYNLTDRPRDRNTRLYRDTPVRQHLEKTSHDSTEFESL